MNLAMEKRLMFIESRLFWEGHFRRNHIEEFFNISTPQATKDIKMYLTRAPENIKYDTKAKQYVIAKNFHPIFGQQTSEKYLTRLLHLKRKSKKDNFFCGTLVNYEQLPKLRRYVSTEILKKILRSIKESAAMNIYYQSWTKDQPTKRWIAPHSLAHDGSRWHVRAFCHDKKRYSDFNLGRILDVYGNEESDFDSSLDFEWNTEIILNIAANPELTGGKKACIELDYCMENGEKEFKIKAAFFFYIRLYLGFDDSQNVNSARQQHIILKNQAEVNTQLNLLRNMSKTSIETAIEEGARIY